MSEDKTMDHDNNRSSALTPDVLALINTQTASAVSEALKGVFAHLQPVFEQMALTPDKIRELTKPYIDPKVAARELRESQMSREQEQELQRATAWRKANCPHLDKNGNASISLMTNNLDHQVRGICMLCHDIIHPREWVIDAPDPVTGKTKAHVREAHKDYARVLAVQSMA